MGKVCDECNFWESTRKVMEKCAMNVIFCESTRKVWEKCAINVIFEKVQEKCGKSVQWM